MAHWWYRIARGACGLWFWLTHHGVRAEGVEKLPQGAAIICPNHTSLRDPLYMAVACGRNEPLRFMAKAEIWKSKFLGNLIASLGAFPVRRGEADLDAIRESMNILKTGQKLLVFPEGTRVTEGKDVEAKAGAAMLAAKTGAPIIPVAIVNGRKYFTPTRVIFGDPIQVTGRREQQRLAAAQVMKAIGDLGCR